MKWWVHLYHVHNQGYWQSYWLVWPILMTFIDLFLQVYLISSALVWGVQFLSLVDAEFPVWYPYYGNWIAAIIVEIALLVGHSLLRRPVDSFDFISISLQSLRLCNFILLPCVYVAAGNRKETYETGDAERQSLLRNEFTPKPSASGESGPTANEYGATIDSSNDGSKKKTDEEEANEDSVWKRHREAEEKIAKRLKADGNWWTYCKGFFVSIPCTIRAAPGIAVYLITRYSSRTSGLSTARFCSFEPYSLEFACLRRILWTSSFHAS